MEQEASGSSFMADKARVLSQVDLSRKGSVDEAIAPLLSYVNEQNFFYTTSSCAGRLVLFADGREKKKGCQWLLVSHDHLDPAQLEEVLSQERPGEEGYIYFKFEPFVLHVMCASLSDAKLMFQVAIGSGFRNSGMSCGQRARWMIAVRGTHSLEIPLACNSTLLTPVEYRRLVVDIGNAKLQKNLERVERFHHELQVAIERRRNPPLTPMCTKKTHQVCKTDLKLSPRLDSLDTASDVGADIATLFSQQNEPPTSGQ